MHLNYQSDPRTCNDKWIVDLTNAKTNGYFVEAGACDGINASNTYVLEKQLNWQGICVEPMSFFYNELVKNRKICENVCLYSEEKEVDFIECNYTTEGITISDRRKKGYMGYLSGISKHLHPKFKLIHDKGKTVRKQCITLESLLDKHNAPNIIDYISLDTEGTEYEILENFPFSKYTVMAFSIEDNGSWNTNSDLLRDNGYIEVKNQFVEPSYEHFYVHPSTQYHYIQY